MIGPRLDISAEIEVRSPLHIGSGDPARSDDIRNESKEDRAENDTTDNRVEIAAVVVDLHGLPAIPGSTLKGAARAIMARHPLESRLFGPRLGSIDGSQEEARAGSLTFRTARVVPGALPDLAGAPFAAARISAEGTAGQPRAHGEVGLFVEAQTKIDRARGIAEAGRLFHRQAVAPGMRFRLELSLGRPDADAEAAARDLLHRLADGFSIGSRTGSDQGRMALDRDTVEAVRYRLDDDLEFRGEPAAGWFAGAGGAPAVHGTVPETTVSLVLACRGAFLVNDASAQDRRDAERAERAGRNDLDDPEAPHLAGLHGYGAARDLPRLPAASLRGALRARAAWLAHLTLAGEDREDDRDRRFGHDVEDAAPAPGAARPDREEHLRRATAALTPVERIFGTNGWRSLLRIRGLECRAHDGWEDFTSVRLDRFSGGPVDGGLFSLRASMNPVFDVTLSLERRGAAPLDGDTRFFRDLLKDLDAQGIELGHATNRGFGWFSVRQAA